MENKEAKKEEKIREITVSVDEKGTKRVATKGFSSLYEVMGFIDVELNPTGLKAQIIKIANANSNKKNENSKEDKSGK